MCRLIIEADQYSKSWATLIPPAFQQVFDRFNVGGRILQPSDTQTNSTLYIIIIDIRRVGNIDRKQ